jgi:hypothetical protein
MRASGCSFNQMMKIRASKPVLAQATSFMQIEFGIDELIASWRGFVDITDECGMEFLNRKEICDEFTDALTEYIRYVDEKSPSFDVG